MEPYRLLIAAAQRHRGDDRHFSSPLNATWRAETHRGFQVFFEIGAGRDGEQPGVGKIRCMSFFFHAFRCQQTKTRRSSSNPRDVISSEGGLHLECGCSATASMGWLTRVRCVKGGYPARINEALTVG